MAIIDYNNGTATISINGGQAPFSYLLLQNGTAVTHPGVNFQNPIVSSNNSVVFGDASDLTGSYGISSGTYTCQITDDLGCVVTTSEIVVGQTQEATTTTLATTPATTLLQEYISLTVDQSPVNEGLNVLFTLTSSNIPNNTMVDWSISGSIDSNDISGGLAGTFTIVNNQAQYLATIETDNLLEGQEELTLTLAAIDTNGISAGLSVDVIINDMNTAATTLATNATTIATNATTIATNATTIATNATTIATNATTEATDATTEATTSTTLATTTTTLATTTQAIVEYELFTAYTNRDEGQSAFFELQYTNGTPGTTVGFTLSGTAAPAFEMGGMIEPMDYTEPTDMFFTVGTSGFVILEIPINEDQQTEGTETIILTLDAQDSDGNPTGSLQKTVTINDTSELPDWEIIASTHDEGITFNHILNTEHVPAGTEYFWSVSVAIGYPWTPASAADFVGGVVPSGSGTIPAYNETLSQSAVIPISIVADSLAEGDEVYQIIVREGSESGPIREITMMTITDSSLPTTTLATTTTTLATTTLPTFTCDDANFTVNTGVENTGVSATSTGVPTLIVPAHYVLGVNSYTATITVPATDANGNAYSNAGGSIECTAVGVGIVATTLATTTLATTTTEAPLEHTFYHFHAGGGSVAPYSDLSAGGTFYLSTGAPTQDLSVMMADLIENGDGQTSGNGVAMPSVNSFEFSGPITGNDCGQSWESELSSGLNFFWLAVPNNTDFTENLITDGVLQYDCNGQPYNANNRTAFTYNAESYWLYKLAAAPSSNAQTYGFK